MVEKMSLFTTKTFTLLLGIVLMVVVELVNSNEISVSLDVILSSEVDDPRAAFLNFGKKKEPQLPHPGDVLFSKDQVKVLSELFKFHMDHLRDQTDQVEVVFLVDASGSIGFDNFQRELNFTKNLLSDLTVAPAATRVAVVTFAGESDIVRYVDQISKADENNHKCRLLNQLKNITYSGGGTYTKGALLEAYNILERSRSGARKAVFLITDGFSNGGDPRPNAKLLKDAGATIFTFGIENGNIEELHDIASEPGYNYSYLLDSFAQFKTMAHKALHQDLKSGKYVPMSFPGDCDSVCSEEGTEVGAEGCCDVNAVCTCGIATGHYSCLCSPGYFGSGLRGSCHLCPNGTYGLGDVPGDIGDMCTPCPDPNHITIRSPSTSRADCKCSSGFTTNGDKCEAITCPKLKVPVNGYLVKASACNNVVNAACGVRCKVGFHLTGDSIRLCLKNGSWSGVEPQCLLKTCAVLHVPSHGRIRCEYEDETQEIHAGLSAYPIDTRCRFKCDTGYQLRGSEVRNCLPLSRWDGLKVTCRPIKCKSMRRVPNGEISPAICMGMEKVPFGTNCSITCKEGFTLKGPQSRVCGGRNGSWGQSVSHCVDTTVPIITCPANITLETLPGKNYALANWTEAVAIDNSGTVSTIWIETLINSSWKPDIGVHSVTYIAQDASKNKAKCTFSITVIDKEPPIVENCMDPPIYLSESNIGAENVTWDEPVFYDNSGFPVQVNKSHNPGEGVFELGITRVVYTATDKYNNTANCLLNIIVKDACQDFPTPKNGQTDCSEIEEGLQCIIICQEGYAFAISESFTEQTDDNLTLTCSKNNHAWSKSDIPDCSVTKVPNVITQEGSLFIESNKSICNDSAILEQLSHDVNDVLQSELLEICKNDIKCNLLKLDLTCQEDSLSENDEEFNLIRKEQDLRGSNFHVYSENSDQYKDEATEIDGLSEYAMREKRDVSKRNEAKGKGKHKQQRDKIKMKFNIIGKTTETHKNNPKQGIIKLRETIQMMTKSGQLNPLNKRTNQTIAGLALNLNFSFNEDPKERCDAGSVWKKHACVQCPVGTFHNSTREQCQPCPFGEYQNEVGSIECKRCPEHMSTRKVKSKGAEDCIPECRPGYYSSQKRHHKSTLGLEPCIKCQIGFYQTEYARSKCLLCPRNTTTIERGAADSNQCVPLYEVDNDICSTSPCLNGGICSRKRDGVSCECIGDFLGARCEKLPNPCESSPCLNDGMCTVTNQTGAIASYVCSCENGYTGHNCESYIDECLSNPCQNSGTCVTTENQFTCICKDGFEGEACEIALDHCESSPCEEGSTCHSVNGTWQCTCRPGFLGRHCNRQPCDWIPCHSNSICINVEEMNTTKKSSRCECPDGYTGKDCTTRIDHCKDSPCLNNGTCVNHLLNYTCECPMIFSGPNCENELSSDYVMHFKKSGTTDYVMMNGPKYNLSEITICLWLESLDTFNYGTVLSYATRNRDNTITLTDYNGLVLYINGERVVTDVSLNDGYWHFVCVSWKSDFGSWNVYVDGELKTNGTMLANGTVIEAHGTLVIGQEQDRLGGAFAESESFLGKLSLLDIWHEVLDNKVIRNISTLCEPYYGSLISWAQMQQYVHGNIQILNSTFCRTCPSPVIPFKGDVEVNEDASMATYSCEIGYLVRFGQRKQKTLRRKCLKQSQWEGYDTPVCTRVECGFPGYFPSGQLHGKSYRYGDVIHYSCNEGHEIMGNPHRTCTANGTWSGLQPMCIGKPCKNLLAPENGDIDYLIDEHELDDMTVIQVGQRLEFKCNPGFRLVGERVLTCSEAGTWDNAAPSCILSGCPPPKLIANGYIASTSSSDFDKFNRTYATSATDHVSGSSLQIGYFYGDILGFSCHRGHKFQGNLNLLAELKIQCSDNGSWNGFVPDCVPLQCPRPKPVANAKVFLMSGDDTLTEIVFSKTSMHSTSRNGRANKPMFVDLESDPDFHGPFNITADSEEIVFSETSMDSTSSNGRANEPMFVDLESDPDFRGPFNITTDSEGSQMLNLTNSINKRSPQQDQFQRQLNDLFVLGTQISIICNTGYHSVGPTIRQCTEREHWSLFAPYCKLGECDPRIHPLNLLDKKWDVIKFHDQIPERRGLVNHLRKYKRIAGELENFEFVINGSNFGDVTRITCKNDTRINLKDLNVDEVLESLTWTCNEKGLWKLLDEGINDKELRKLLIQKNQDICKSTACGSPEVPINGYIVNDSSGIINSGLRKPGEVVMVKCRRGYILKGGESKSTCMPNGTWTRVSNCEPVTCGRPPKPPNTGIDKSSAKASGNVFGNMVTYHCLPGFRLSGHADARCLANGRWSRMFGKCHKISCGRPTTLPGVRILGWSYLYKDLVTYVCPGGRKRSMLICKSNGKWSNPPDCTKN